MREFTFGFLRGLTVPIYLIVGAVEGIAIGWNQYQKDTALLRPLWVKSAPPEVKRP